MTGRCTKCNASIPKAELIFKTRKFNVGEKNMVVLILCDECFDLIQHDSLKSYLELHDKTGVEEIEVFSGNAKRKKS